MMVFALLAVLAAIGLTGAMNLGGMLKQGPLRASLPELRGHAGIRPGRHAGHPLLAMIGAHLAGVAFESFRGRENPVAAMLTGHKAARPPAESAQAARAYPRTALAIMLVLLAASATAIAALTALPGRRVPSATLDPVFALQCGACHLAFPPSLAPAATWDGILADLQHHFGADATDSPEQIAQIRTWVDDNAAGRWDTLPSHLLGVAAADGSLRITDTPGSAATPRHRRRGVCGEARLSPRNCSACHADAATGLFAPQDIAIPDMARP